jgi:hypothetical protein
MDVRSDPVTLPFDSEDADTGDDNDGCDDDGIGPDPKLSSMSSERPEVDDSWLQS